VLTVLNISGQLPGNGKGTGPEFTDYFGDNGNITTLNHRLYMADIFPNITIADIMDIGANVICSEYID
jgi:tyrosinase